MEVADALRDGAPFLEISPRLAPEGTAGQQELRFGGEDHDVEAAFRDGRLYLQVDQPYPMTARSGWFAGDSTVHLGTPIRFVHVISRPAGGEIRGYVLVEDDPTLRLRYPSYPEAWPELDAAVQVRITTPV